MDAASHKGRWVPFLHFFFFGGERGSVKRMRLLRWILIFEEGRRGGGEDGRRGKGKEKGKQKDIQEDKD